MMNGPKSPASPSATAPRRRKVLAIASGGGHFVELMRVVPALRGHFVTYATVDEAYRAQLPEDAPLTVIPDVTRWDRLGLVRGVAAVTRLCLVERPDVVISTGALPGFFGMVIGKRLGARTMWLDSLANVEELSLSGQKVGPHADLWLTQWPELARPGGPTFAGSVLRLEPASAPAKSPHDKRIFVTVGAQMPFERLVRAVDQWAAAHPEHQVFVQTGDSAYVPQHAEHARFLSPDAFERAYDDADAIVGHAGVGTIFAALERGKPLLVLPREAARKETRNDHQGATARRFQELAGLGVAWTEDAIVTALDDLTEQPSARLAPHASDALLEAIAAFVDERPAAAARAEAASMSEPPRELAS